MNRINLLFTVAKKQDKINMWSEVLIAELMKSQSSHHDTVLNGKWLLTFQITNIPSNMVPYSGRSAR